LALALESKSFQGCSGVAAKGVQRVETVRHGVASTAWPMLSAVTRMGCEVATVMASEAGLRAVWMIPRHGGCLRNDVRCTGGQVAQISRQAMQRLASTRADRF
jgi:hypothetical protein